MLLKALLGSLQLLATAFAFENDRFRIKSGLEFSGLVSSDTAPFSRASRVALLKKYERINKLDQSTMETTLPFASAEYFEAAAEEEPQIRVKRAFHAGIGGAANGLATSIMLLVLAVVIIIGTIVSLICKCCFYIMKCCKGHPVSRPPSAISQIVPVSD